MPDPSTTEPVAPASPIATPNATHPAEEGAHDGCPYLAYASTIYFCNKCGWSSPAMSLLDLPRPTEAEVPSPEEVRDLLTTVKWMLRQERNEIISIPRLADMTDEKKRRLEHLFDVDGQVKAMLKRLPPHPPMSDEQFEKVGAVVGAALRKRFGEGSADEVAAAVKAAWPEADTGGSEATDA